MFSRSMQNKNICHSQSTFGATDRLSSAKRNRWMHNAQHSALFILLPPWQATKFLSACDQVIANCCHPVAVSKWIWTGHHEMAAVVDDLTEEQLACSCTWISNPPWSSCLASFNSNNVGPFSKASSRQTHIKQGKFNLIKISSSSNTTKSSN